MTDVSAILLSSGEPFVERARRSVEAQTYPVDEIIPVENISPFHRAFADGVTRVRSSYFVQVDADMVLDATCVERLRSAMEHDVGVICGNLRDPLSGQVEGIKLFRTSIAKRIRHSDSVSSETEFVQAMERQGWRLKYVGRAAPDSGVTHETYGDHLPDYSPHYTFQKYLLEGRKYRYRGARAGLFSKLHALGQSTHEMVPLARIALAHGFFLDADRDMHVPTRASSQADAVVTLLASDREYPTPPLFPLSRHATLRDVFHAFISAGSTMAAGAAGRAVHDVLAALTAEGRGWPVMVATLAFGHGIVSANHDAGALSVDERKLRAFVYLGIGRKLPLVRHVRANIERLYYELPQLLVPARVVPWWRRVPPW